MPACSRCGKQIPSQYIVCLDCYKSNTYQTRKGYRKFKDSGEYVHREIAATKNHVPVKKIGVVHHRNGNKADNRPSNLQILPDQAAHARLHRLERNSQPKADDSRGPKKKRKAT